VWSVSGTNWTLISVLKLAAKNKITAVFITRFFAFFVNTQV